jgi:hypothetical protein
MILSITIDGKPEFYLNIGSNDEKKGKHRVAAIFFDEVGIDNIRALS